ncbi:TPA: M1 family metallopeptidase [Elizabethkingia anophelis]|uniref:M1 family metallopeptidase n=1 Tax=Elizabethkingia anophelis TaxID=1117645 RepID=UPI0004049867|nr:M1 family metallopeptidase [Elizabethkingia anophelis]MCT3744899.1 M1 family metallopeptidase [Elizabethkingia anophelis]MDC8025711.1 M1 family metallopeptidase [Elizabethkingia anophelis]MDV3489822.1 aminopeptidase [Elizabethkingia anophelis]MDV4129892.1 aminopeptidase [Elizabethkingia anophelis]MDV4135673.1 aminopeptidase [Elizabethkingia anophelis]
MVKNFLSIALMLVFGLGLAQKGPYYQQKAKYKMDIDVDATKFTYLGKQSIQYTNNSPDELKVIYMHLYWNAFKSGSMMDERVRNQGKNSDKRLQKDGVSRLASIPADQEGRQNIHWIKQNGKDLKFEIQETVMKVILNEPLKPNSTTSLSMEWDANIPMQIRRAGRNNSEGVDMTMTQWYPKISEYDYDGWAAFDYIGREFHAPFSDFDVTIKIDKNYVLGAGGNLENPTEVKGYTAASNVKADQDGKATWKWTAKNILDFAWAADRDYSVDEFTVLGGPKVYFVYQKSEKTKYWEEAKPYVTKYFQIMNAQFGQYAWPSYSFIQGGDGGMEYGMCTMILGEAKSVKDLCGLMFHEGSHSWYQQMLATNESVRPWMDEGFTSYAEAYVSNQLFPPAKPQANPFVSSINNYIKFVKTGKEEPASWLGDHHDDGTAYTFASYVKGELFLVELGYIMGEQNLSKTMKKYYDDWSMKHPTDRDFIHIAQKISGMDLKWFQNYWINTTKTIDYGIKSVKYGDTSTTITLTNNGTLPMPIDFNVLTKDKKVLTYHIPLNMMRTAKTTDIYGPITIMPFWNWTMKDYELTIPYSKAQLQAIGIDFSQRLADVNPADNIIEVK